MYQRTAVVNCLAPETSLVAALSGSAFLGESLAATASSISLNSSNPNKDPTIFPPYVAIPPLAKDKIFAERRVYFAADLGIRFGMESALKQRIIDGGGTCWSWSLDGADAVASTKADSGRKVDQWARRRAAERELKRANTVVMRFREGWEFWVVRVPHDLGAALTVTRRSRRTRRSETSPGSTTYSPRPRSHRPWIAFSTTLCPARLFPAAASSRSRSQTTRPSRGTMRGR